MPISGEKKAELRRMAYSAAALAIADVDVEESELQSDEERGYVTGFLDELAEHMRRMSQ
jgi:hypothetical protein